MNQWKYFLEFISNKSVKFSEFPVFYFYLIGIVIGIGGFSIWATIYLDLCSDDLTRNLKLSLMGFSLPIITSFAIDIFKLNVEEDFVKLIFQILLIVTSVVFTVLFVVFFKSNFSLIISLLNVFFAIFFWWILNFDNKNLRDNSYYQRERERTKTLEESI